MPKASSNVNSKVFILSPADINKLNLTSHIQNALKQNQDTPNNTVSKVKQKINTIEDAVLEHASCSKNLDTRFAEDFEETNQFCTNNTTSETIKESKKTMNAKQMQQVNGIPKLNSSSNKNVSPRQSKSPKKLRTIKLLNGQCTETSQNIVDKNNLIGTTRQEFTEKIKNNFQNTIQLGVNDRNELSKSKETKNSNDDNDNKNNELKNLDDFEQSNNQSKESPNIPKKRARKKKTDNTTVVEEIDDLAAKNCETTELATNNGLLKESPNVPKKRGAKMTIEQIHSVEETLDFVAKNDGTLEVTNEETVTIKNCEASESVKERNGQLEDTPKTPKKRGSKKITEQILIEETEESFIKNDETLELAQENNNEQLQKLPETLKKQGRNKTIEQTRPTKEIIESVVENSETLQNVNDKTNGKSQELPKIPKKRGRKKIIQQIHPVEETIESVAKNDETLDVINEKNMQFEIVTKNCEASEPVKEKNGQLEESPKTPKKRGRKRITEQILVNETEKSIIKNDETLELTDEKNNKQLQKLPESPEKQDKNELFEQTPTEEINESTAENCETLQDVKDENNGELQELPKIPKKRDRKRKTELISAVEKIEDSENKSNEILEVVNEKNSDQFEEVNESAAKNCEILESVIESSTEQLNELPKIPKKRGRKRKTELTSVVEKTGDSESKSNDILEVISGKNSDQCEEVNETAAKNCDNLEIESSNEQLDELPKVPKKRGRKPKTQQIVVAEEVNESTNKNCETPEDLNEKNNAQVEELFKIPKKRGRKRKADQTPVSQQINESAKAEILETRCRKRRKIDYTAFSSGEISETHESNEETTTSVLNSSCVSETPKKRRGRVWNRKPVESSETSAIVKEEKLENIESIKEEKLVEDESKITSEIKQEVEEKGICAVCDQEIEKKKWSIHKLTKHNNLAWRVGETPIDLNNQNLVISILNMLYKKKIPLYCYKCGDKKKSVVGFMSHQTTCNKTDEEIEELKVKCELCQRTMLPVSLSMHMRLSHPETVVKEQKSIPEPNVKDPVTKRQAALKAQDLIQNLVEDEEVVEKISTRDNTHKRSCHINFDFHATCFLKRKLNRSLTDNGQVKCLFKNCEYVSTKLDEILEHVSTCKLKPLKGFTCKFCIITYNSESEIIHHVQKYHTKKINKETESEVENDEESSESDEYEEEEEIEYVKKETNAKDKKSLTTKKQAVQIGFLRKTPKSKHIPYPLAYRWTYNFCENNYNTYPLFENFDVKVRFWYNANDEDFWDYCPGLDESVDTARIIVNGYINTSASDYEWKRYKLFESELHEDGSSTIFTGGVVHTVAWAPTPYTSTDSEQILAMSIILDPDQKFRMRKIHDSSGLIQFWNYGPLSNNETSKFKPEYLFGIGHDYGVVYQMEWCPSGCYDSGPLRDVEKDETFTRLGLLAVSCANPFAYIYAVARPGQFPTYFYKPRPVLKLQLETISYKAIYHSTRISWTKSAGHKIVAVGYSSGMVALYDLSTESELLKLGEDEDGVETLLPYKTFQAHYHCITALALFHLNDGRRWLMTGSTDRFSKFWDLENVHTPLTSLRKHLITDGVWLTNWLCSIFSFDEGTASGCGTLPTTLNQVRDYLTDVTSLFHSASTVHSVTGNDWANGILQGTAAGEVIGSFPHQLFCRVDSDKSLKTKRLLFGYVGIVEKGLAIPERLKIDEEKYKALTNQLKKQTRKELCNVERDITHLDFNPHYFKYEPIEYIEAAEKYGIVFCDFKLDSIRNFKPNISTDLGAKTSKMIIIRPNLYPLQSIRTIAFNPNRQSHLYYAAGYRSGFVKVACLSYMKGSGMKKH